MKNKILSLLLIVCLVAPPLFADYEAETGAAADAFLSGDPLLIGLGVGILILVVVCITLPLISEANKPSDGLYLVSDDSSVVKQNERKDSIFDHVRPVVDFQYSQTGNIQTYVGVQLSF